jgi:hypothetical protein
MPLSAVVSGVRNPTGNRLHICPRHFLMPHRAAHRHIHRVQFTAQVCPGKEGCIQEKIDSVFGSFTVKLVQGPFR